MDVYLEQKFQAKDPRFAAAAAATKKTMNWASEPAANMSAPAKLQFLLLILLIKLLD
jgi:hypothetical protein